MKKVSYQDYWQEIEKSREQLGEDFVLCNLGSTLDHPEIQMGVNWPAKGTVPAEEAVAFARGLLQAAEAAASFKYNGYKIEY